MKAMSALRPYVASVIGELEDESLIHIGSGLVCEVVDPNIITAEHVLALPSVPDELTGEHVRIVRKRYATDAIHEATAIQSPQATCKFPVDLARFEVGGNTLKGCAQSVLDIERVPRKERFSGSDLFLLLGLPGVKSRTLFGQVTVTLYGALTTLALITEKRFDSNLHVGFAYQAHGWLDTNGESIAPLDPHGMSGSAVWNLNLPEDYRDWRPELATVAGIAIDIQDDNKVIVATCAREVNDFAFPSNRIVEAAIASDSIREI